MLSTDVDKLKFVSRLIVAPKFPANKIQMWISTHQVNYYFYSVFGLKVKEKTKSSWKMVRSQTHLCHMRCI